MSNSLRRRWYLGLAAGFVSCALAGSTSVHAQSIPIVVPPSTAVVVGITPALPSPVIGIPGLSGMHSRDEVTWSTRGRADVDVDIDRQHGQAAAR
jgi:hypothetical protein